jgi:hypothetical protein
MSATTLRFTGGKPNKCDDFDEFISKFSSPCLSGSQNVQPMYTFGAVEVADFVSDPGSARSLLDELPVVSGVTFGYEFAISRGPFSFPDLGSIGDGIFSGRFTPEIALTSPQSFSPRLVSPILTEGDLFENRHRGKFGSMKKRSALGVQ